ncbi:23S rRNA (uracil747-C5)-methyltransferase [Hydrocarboniphaga daqingensis]|uniref:23S rRNA (Uracil747-C5)-methyltransferase n=1 Tax=Hydrocarboniphaga daqingensis TaxID=490188 RepID=A0A1M5K4F5_9GAMM|nr:23S rRNA (uracil(747)-C(5))-methyltransferase [Hydrocarboniphaga daqingensis]SHG47601.1 23S rRNA (uracil747-C5)-methyltransferase [Hydrocarboniphaga daqingensis]
MQCSHFDAGRCRSCTQLPQPYPQQLAAKQQRARDALASWPELDWLPAIDSAESGFRNKAKMVVSGSWRRPVLGILDADGKGVDLSDCALYSPGLQASFATLESFIALAVLSPYNVALRRGELKYLLLTESDTGELMLRFVLRSDEAVERIRLHLPTLQQALPQLRTVSVNLQPEHKAILEGEQEILLTPETPELTIQVNDLPLRLRPQSFFQTNTPVAGALYAQAREWVEQAEPSRVWDLYCGVGGFALHVASRWRDVVGVETSRDAVASAQRTADALGYTRLALPRRRRHRIFAAGRCGARAGHRQSAAARHRRRTEPLAGIVRRRDADLFQLQRRITGPRPGADAVAAAAPGPLARHVSAYAAL